MIINRIEHYQIENNRLFLHSGPNDIILSFARQNILRIQYSDAVTDECSVTLDECSVILDECSVILMEEPNPFPFESYERNGSSIEIYTQQLRVCIEFKPLKIKILDSGSRELLLTEEITFFEVCGRKKTVRFKLGEDEKIYGLGQDPMAKLDKRDQERRMWQQWNTHRRSGNAGVPFMMSSRGYGVFLNSSWASRFAVGKAEIAIRGSGDNLAPAPWSWHEPSGENNPQVTSILLEDGPVDLFILAGNSPEKLLNGYASLTGYAPLVPKWALGLIQSKNRYRTWEELLYVGNKYREKGIPCDVLVIDWLWFKNFGDMEWDKSYWSNARENLKKLSDMGFKILQAQHPFIEKNCLKYEEFKKMGFLNEMPELDVPYYRKRPTFDHTNPAAREEWWKLSKCYLDEGIKGFWTDMGEVQVDPEGTTSYAGPREKVHNLYSIMWNKGLYEGSRRNSDERVFSLARTTYAGIEKYGSVMWSGDVDSTWQVFKDQVVIGQGVCLSGQQYWCTDVGGFFTGELRSGVKYGNNYQGAHGEGLTPELYIRWFEFGTFCPLFRTHGTRPGNEAWSFGESTEKIIKKYIDLRYRLIPYIYSCAAEVTRSGKPIMRAMCVDYGEDEKALKFNHQYLFGPSILVAPVVDKGKRTQIIYLPKGNWYNLHTGKKLSGNQEIVVDAPLDIIPLFVREGSILPYGPVMNYVDEKPPENLDLHIYTGSDGSFDLYDDDGKTYGYERGNCCNTVFEYFDKEHHLIIHNAKGQYDGMPKSRSYTVYLHNVQRPGTVTLCGSEYSDWIFDDINEILKISFSDLPVDKKIEVAFTQTDETVAVNACGTYAVSLDADCDIEPSGELTIHSSLKNRLDIPAIRAKVSLDLPEGWFVQCCPSEYDSVFTDSLSFEFYALPLADALSVLHTAIVTADIFYQDGHTEKLSKSITWGSGYNARWLIIGSFEMKKDDTIDTIYPVENETDCNYYEHGEKKYYWKRLTHNEFNSFGYVDFRENGLNSVGDSFIGGSYSGVSYAKCRVFSPIEQKGYVSFSSEKGIKIWFDGKEIVQSSDIVLEKTVEKPIVLENGWNDLLIKSTMQTAKPFSGREYGFNFRIVDESGNPIRNLLYKA